MVKMVKIQYTLVIWLPTAYRSPLLVIAIELFFLILLFGVFSPILQGGPVLHFTHIYIGTLLLFLFPLHYLP